MSAMETNSPIKKEHEKVEKKSFSQVKIQGPDFTSENKIGKKISKIFQTSQGF